MSRESVFENLSRGVSNLKFLHQPKVREAQLKLTVRFEIP